MTIRYKNVYINETSTITGPYEQKGPLNNYFDKSYDDLYFKQPTWEQAESKLVNLYRLIVFFCKSISDWGSV